MSGMNHKLIPFLVCIQPHDPRGLSGSLVDHAGEAAGVFGIADEGGVDA